MRTILPGTPRDPVLTGLPEVQTAQVWATHPTVAATPADGHNVVSVFPHGGTLLMGYGDWVANTGPVDLLGIDLATAEPVTLYEGVWSEAVEVFRVIDGALYVPWIDTRAGTGGGGYLSNSGGTWHEVTVPDLIHTFDVTSSAGLLVAVGSASDGGVMVSDDAGATWTRDAPIPNGTRWHTVIGTDVGYGLPGTGHWHGPGGWGPWPLTRLGSRVEHARPEHGSTVFGAGLAVDRATGATTEISRTYTPQAVDGGVLYGARWYDGDLLVATADPDQVAWSPVLRLAGADLVPPGAYTLTASSEGGIAVVDGFVYVGGSQGRVYRTPLPQETP